jgi:multidrug efflux pump subunit AcrA (membrane-fusion protein)
VAAWSLGIAAFFGIKKHRYRRGLFGVVVAVTIPWLVGLGPAGWALATNAGSLEYRRAANAVGANSAFVEALGSEASQPKAPGPDSRIANLEQTEVEISERLVANVDKDLMLTQRVYKTSEKRQRLREELALALAQDPSEHPKRSEQIAQIRAQLKRLRSKEQRIRSESRKLAAAKVELEQERAAIIAAQQQVQGRQQDIADSESLDPDIAHLPRGLSVMLFEPVPWATGGSTTLQMARAEALFWYPLLVMAAVGLWVARSHLRVLSFPLSLGGGILLMYALAEGNIGTAFRHRGEFVWVVAVLAALGLHQVIALRQQRKAETVITEEG